MTAERRVLGWREWVSLPELGIEAVKAKVDTGARSSSIHAEHIRFIEREGQRLAQFSLGVGDEKSLVLHGDGHIEVPLLDVRWITSSNGTRQKRAVIKTPLVIGNARYKVEVSLSGRSAMGFPMLLGREAIRERYLVDAGRSFLEKGHIPATSLKQRRNLQKLAQKG